MRFIPFIDKTKAVDFTAATTLARRLSDDFKISPAPPQYTVKSLISALSGALDEENVVVIGVTNKYYLKLKKALAIVLKNELYENESLKADIIAVDKDAHELYYKFMNGNVIFRSADGFYSGYGISAKPHKIIVLPLSDEKYLPMLQSVKDFVLDNNEEYNEAEVLMQSGIESRRWARVFAITSLLSVIASLGVAFYEVLR